MKIIIAVLCLVALAATSACAYDGLTNITLGNMGTYGWHSVAYNYNARTATVSAKSAYGSPAANCFQFMPEKPASTLQAYASVSYPGFGGMQAASLTSLRIKTFGLQGDDVNNYQPGTFMFLFKKGPANASNRFAIYLPWTNGNPRANGSNVWQEYDAMNTGSWYIPNIGATYTSFAAMLTANPTLTFLTDAEIAASYPTTVNRSAFNVGLGSSFNEEQKYISSGRGEVDWVEIGVSNYVRRWDFNEVPEPSAIVALLTGLVGFVGLRKRS